MEKDAYEAAQTLDKQVLIWAIVLLGALGIALATVLGKQLKDILRGLQGTVDRLALGFERHNVLLEKYGEDIKDNRTDITELQRRKTR